MPAGITASAYDSNDGTITLTGSASKSDYEAALERIRYDNTSTNPDSADRIITVVVNDGTDDSNVATATISINSLNNAPVIGNLSEADLVFNEADGPLLLDQNAAATVTDIDSPDFDGGTLTVTILADGRVAAEDVLGIDTTSVTLSNGTNVGSTVTVGATLIGTIATGGTGNGGNDLVIDLNSAATPALVQTVVQSLTYSNNDAIDATAGTRTIRVTLTDGDGGATTFGDVEFAEQTGANNPFDGVTVGTNGSAPSFVDIDGDGDLDAFIGAEEALDGGSITAFENTGSATAPVFTQVTAADNPFGGATFSRTAVIDFADLDNDGDMDALVGDLTGGYRAFENTGTATDANFVEVTGADNPFAPFGVDDRSSPVFVDIDNDGDLDMFSGADGGSVDFFENIGSENEPEFVAQSGSNPLSSAGVNRDSVLAFADLDNDGDLDVVIGERGGTGGGPLHVWENTGTVTSPIFTEVTGAASPLDGILIDNGRPAFADIDGDGDLDLFVGNDAGGVQFFENTAVSSSASITVTVNNLNGDPVATLDEFSAKMGDTITGNLITGGGGNAADADGDGDPIAMFITGRYNSYNGGSVLLNSDGSFTYEAPTGFVGFDTFAYAIEDGQGGFDVGYASILLSEKSTTPIIRNGAAADELLSGSSGSDTLSGFAGDDILRGDTSEQSRIAVGDVLDGGGDNDVLWTEGGRSTLIGGSGNDHFVSRDQGLFYDLATVDYSTSTSGVFVNLTDTLDSGVEAHQASDGLSGGTDFLSGVHAFTDSANNDTFLSDGSFANSLNGLIQVNLGTGGSDTVDFTGSNADVRRVSFQNAGSGVTASLATGAVTGGVIVTLTNINELFGSASGDTLTGDGSDNVLRGSAGVDTLDGGGGNDTVDFRDATTTTVVNLTLGSGQVLQDGFGNVESLTSIENILGSAFRDIYTGNNDDNILVGLAGDDRLFGQDGDDTLYGDFDDPDFQDGGFGGADFLAGGGGDDELFGGAGDDLLFGDNDDDWLWGGSGNDTLHGNAGDDVLLSGGAPQNWPSTFTSQDRLFGGDGDDILFGQGGASFLQGDAGNDIIRGDDSGGWADWTQVSYQTSTSGIIANLTGTTQFGLNPGEVSDGIEITPGVFGIDSVSRVHVIRDSVNDDQIFWDDSFAGSFGNFVEVRLTAGDDLVDFTGATGQRRVSYETAKGGVFIDMTANATDGSGRRQKTVSAATSVPIRSSTPPICAAASSTMSSLAMRRQRATVRPKATIR